jgi:hypothetical protein
MLRLVPEGRLSGVLRKTHAEHLRGSAKVSDLAEM